MPLNDLQVFFSLKLVLVIMRTVMIANLIDVHLLICGLHFEYFWVAILHPLLCNFQFLTLNLVNKVELELH